MVLYATHRFKAHIRIVNLRVATIFLPVHFLLVQSFPVSVGARLSATYPNLLLRLTGLNLGILVILEAYVTLETSKCERLPQLSMELASPTSRICALHSTNLSKSHLPSRGPLKASGPQGLVR
jgi:hypothetical protein